MECHYWEVRAGWPHTQRPSGLEIWVGDPEVRAWENDQAVWFTDLSWHVHWSRQYGPGEDVDVGADVASSSGSLQLLRSSFSAGGLHQPVETHVVRSLLCKVQVLIPTPTLLLGKIFTLYKPQFCHP